MKTNIILVFLVFFLVVLGCATRKNTPEVEARVKFASETNWGFPFEHVTVSAEGEERKVLEITILDKVPPYAVSDTVELLVSDKMKAEAKALGFTQIHVEGGRASLGDPDTIDRTISLR